MLSRLAGRSRALEVVLGSDLLDADTAALYGCNVNPFPISSSFCACLSAMHNSNKV